MEGQQGAAQSPLWFDSVLHAVATAVEAVGVAVIVLGAVWSLAVVVRARLREAQPLDEGYHAFRTSLARSILLGLEFLVAADIIGTVAVDPTLRNLGVLGLIVLIRTFLSFSLEIEITGRWPWRKGEGE